MPSQAQMAYHSSPACWSGARASVTPARCTRVHPGCIPVLFFSGRRLEEKQPSSAQGSRMPPRACSSQFCHVGPLLKHRRDPSAAQSSDSRRPDLASRRGDCRPVTLRALRAVGEKFRVSAKMPRFLFQLPKHRCPYVLWVLGYLKALCTKPTLPFPHVMILKYSMKERLKAGEMTAEL